jgi:hypothetical protein
MSRKQVVAGFLLVAVVGASFAVWLWRPWEHQSDGPNGGTVFFQDEVSGELVRRKLSDVLDGSSIWPDPATACTVVCINQTDKPIIYALEFTYSGYSPLKFRSLGGGPGLVSNAIPEGVGLDRPSEGGDGQVFCQLDLRKARAKSTT